MNKFIILIFPISIALVIFFSYLFLDKPTGPYKLSPWQVKSIDTVKYSRDLTGQMLDKPEFDTVIDQQVAQIASTNASHIAIATPYDERFVPFLRRWVRSAREHNLNVWFRGNFSGWEEWFGYEKISPQEHKKLLEEFIIKNPDLFEDGDIFTSCPECENGGEGDPRNTGKTQEFKQFLIDEYQISLKSFGKINKKVSSGYYSMNYDVANLIMDPQTTQALGGIVVIDHYIKSPTQLEADITSIAQKSGGKVVLGEFGAPIPDIHGDMTESEQSAWIQQAMENFLHTPSLIGVNYWTNVGGSTQLWSSSGEPRAAVETLKTYFKQK